MVILLGFNKKLKDGMLFAYFQYIKGDITRFLTLRGELR